MRWLTEQAVVPCGHQGRVVNQPGQRWVRVSGAPVLAEDDPEGRTIAGCPNIGPTVKPCAKTLGVLTGYSSWLAIGGNRVVLSSLDGITDGTVPGTVHYTVSDPGQHYVGADR
jgi:hypothetical protein